MSSFTHLHVHSHYSLLDGLPKIDDLVHAAKAQGATALALTDHGVMYGAIEFYQKATAAGIKPIIGMEAYVTPGSRHQKRARSDERTHHLTLLAQNETGYRNLIALTTIAHLEGFYYRPRVDHEVLATHAEGVIALSGCLKGEVPTAILSGSHHQTEELLKWYAETFPGRYYLELQAHPNIPEQAVVNRELLKYADRFSLPIVATADSHYLTPADAEAQDILLCIHLKKQLDDQNRLSMRHSDFSLRLPAEMEAEFAETPEAIANTHRIADLCNLNIPLGQVQLPHYDVPAGQTPEAFLQQLAEAGIPRRFDDETPAIRERLDYELRVINKTGFASYFLIVQDFVNWAKNQGIVVGPGRGSAAGSLVSYLLNITNIDPLKYDLLFERFLNPERIAMPDIDIDFADTRRDEVIRYVESKYGQDHVSQIITFGTMAARAALRDVGRVLGLPYSYCDRVAKLIPMFSSLDQALESVPELKEIYEHDSDARRLIDGARRLEGVARHASRHACGVVITKDPLTSYLPLQHAGPDDSSIITQYSLHPIEDLGLLKMDFLGLSNLTILENCLSIIQQTRGTELDLDQIPLDDRRTFRLLQKGETTGVFQLESSGMKRYLRELKPTSLEDIIAMVALYRPGPMELIPQFIAGKHGQYKPTYLDPRLKPILEKTYGVAVYQEQVLQMARDIAGFSLGEADVLRKAVGKKIAKLLAEQKDKFVAGAVKNGLSRDVAQRIFEFIEPFARYGFNRSHAACYAVIAYQTAYCKANFPAEFLAALLTSDQHNTDRIAIELDEARRMGIEVLGPDINESQASFAVIPDAENKPRRIRFGLNAVKNVGEQLVDAIVAERQRGQPFISLEDFLRRVQHKDLNKKSLESLVKVGAFDRFNERQALLSNMNELLKFSKSTHEEIRRRQTNLFGTLPTAFAPTLRLAATEAASRSQRGQWEKELMGFYLTDHPLNEHRDRLRAHSIPVKDAREQKSRFLKIGGIVTSVKRITTKRNEPMAFVRIEDQTANVEVVVFPRLFQSSTDLWTIDRILVIEGQPNQRDGEWKLLAEKAWDLRDLPDRATADPKPFGVRVDLANITPQQFRSLREIVAQHPGPRPLILETIKNGQTRLVTTKYHVLPSASLSEELESILGPCIVDL